MIITAFSIFIYLNIISKTSNTVLIHYYQDVLYNLTSSFNYDINEDFSKSLNKNNKRYNEIKSYLKDFSKNLNIEDIYLSTYDSAKKSEILLIHATNDNINTGEKIVSTFGIDSFQNRKIISGHIKNKTTKDGYYSFYSPVLNEEGNPLALIAFNIPDNMFFSLTFSNLLVSIVSLIIITILVITLYIHITTLSLWKTLSPIYTLKNQVSNISNKIFTVNKNINFNVSEFNSIQKLFLKSITLVKDFIMSLIIYLEYIKFSISKIKIISFEIINKIKQATTSINKISQSNENINSKVLILKEDINTFSNELPIVNKEIKKILKMNLEANEVSQENNKLLNEFLVEISILVKKFKNEYVETQKLTKLSNEINEILENILTITNETKLLSLNASIVAISAGDHGKSFGVIAKEVGELSQNIIKSANYIQQTLVKITDNVNNLNLNSFEIFELFNNHSKRAKVFSNNLNEIYVSIKNISTFLKDLHLSSENLNTKNDIILDNIKFLSSNSLGNLNSINQIAELITKVNENALTFRNNFQSLDDNINKIKFEVSDFKL